MIKYKLNSNIYLYSGIDNKNYLIDLDTNNSFRLNNTSYCICSSLENDWTSLDVVLCKLYKLYDGRVETSILKEDIDLFIRELINKSFVISETNL